MIFGYLFYTSISITCVCYTGKGQPPRGTYLYNRTSFPFNTRCAYPAILDPDREYQHRPAQYFSVKVSDCIPPSDTSYAQALRSLGIEVLTELTVHIEHETAQLTPANFNGLSPLLKNLHLTAVGRVVVPEPGSIANLASVKHLTLLRVRPDRLPPSLDTLDVQNAEYTVLPAEALNVIELTLHEPHLTKLNGIGNRLKTITLRAPLTELPLLGSVERVTLIDTAATLIPAYTTLLRLELRQLRASNLQLGFLHGSPKLTHFALLQTRVKQLPGDVFQYSRKLEEIDLSDNEFETIPCAQISTLPKLKVLKMINNRLRSIRFNPLPAGPLRVLDFSGNPIGSTCLNDSNVEQLKHLTTLILSRTEAPYICTEWLQSMKYLKTLDLSFNHISFLSCPLLYLTRGAKDPDVEINLTGNELDVLCDYMDLSEKPKRLQIKATGELHIKCSCSAHWLIRVQRNFSVPFRLSAPLAQCYDNTSLPCRVRARCLPKAGPLCHAFAYASTYDEYMVNDQALIMEYDDGNSFKVSCFAAQLEDIAFPAFPIKRRFTNVTLSRCRPPTKHKSYAEALSLINVTIGENFFLYELPTDTVFTDDSLTGIPSLQLLHLEAKETGVLKISGYQLGLTQPLTTLHLVRVTSKVVPVQLRDLSLIDTGSKKLPAGAIEVYNLTIKENITSLVGLSHRMLQLSVTAPLSTLPNATGLLVLKLTGAQLKPGFVAAYPQLQTLKLHALMMPTIPAQFLRGGSKLKYFALTHNVYPQLPLDLFSFSPHLISIDLSNNHLDSVPKELFSGLKELQTLNLNDNNPAILLQIPALKSFTTLMNVSVNVDYDPMWF